MSKFRVYPGEKYIDKASKKEVRIIKDAKYSCKLWVYSPYLGAKIVRRGKLDTKYYDPIHKLNKYN